MVGRKYEAGGIAKDGAKMVTAVATAAVPKFTVIIGGIVRRRQLRHVRPRLLAALPVDVAERAHQRHGRRAGGQRAGARCGATAWRRADRPGPADEEEAFKAPIREQYEAQGHPYYATRPAVGRRRSSIRADTRRVLGLALSASLNAPIEPTRFGVFRM